MPGQLADFDCIFGEPGRHKVGWMLVEGFKIDLSPAVETPRFLQCKQEPLSNLRLLGGSLELLHRRLGSMDDAFQGLFRLFPLGLTVLWKSVGTPRGRP